MWTGFIWNLRFSCGEDYDDDLLGFGIMTQDYVHYLSKKESSGFIEVR